MKAFVTGGTGFVGSHLVKRLLREGHQVYCYAKGAEIPDLEEYDIIYHIAGVLGKHGTPISEYEAVHIDLADELQSRMNKHQKFIYMSSNCTNFFKHPYGITKLIGENNIATSGLNYSIIKPGFIYGEGDKHHLPLFKVVKATKVFPLFGGGDNIVAPTYIKDVINGIMYASKNDIKMIPIAGEWVSMRLFVQTIARAIGRELKFVKLPSFDLPIIGHLVRSNFFTSELKLPTYMPGTPLKHGISSTINWYRRQGWL